MVSSKVWKALAVLAKLHSRGELDKDLADSYEYDLRGYPEDAVMHALSRCRREVNKFPTIADIVSRIDDGRPGAEEAWAMIPTSEDESVVWSEEMRAAFAIARPLLDRDPIAARMAFREAYERIVTDARACKLETKWVASLGHDLGKRALALQVAVQNGRIPHTAAERLLPDYSVQPKQLQLEAPKDTRDRFTGIASVIDRILSNAPDAERRQVMARRKLLTTKKEPELTPEEIELRKQVLLNRLKADV